MRANEFISEAKVGKISKQQQQATRGLNIFSKKINVNATTIPIAKFTPIPPLLFIKETATAIKVKINAEIGKLNFL